MQVTSIWEVEEMAREERGRELTPEERERIRAEERERMREEDEVREDERRRARGEDDRHDDETVHEDTRRDERQWDDRHPDERDRRDVHTHHATPATVRGGISLGSILTGMAVALGAMFLLTALIGGIAFAMDLADVQVNATAEQIGWGVGIALVLAMFLAYLWGGYSAGRMARGAGLLNGVLVPVAALLLTGLVALIVWAVGAEVRIAAPFTPVQIPVDQDLAVTFGTVLGIASLVAMFGGAALGGWLGSRWHDKLEATVVDEPGVPRVA